MPNICIIPARGGSKRIPRKNIKGFLGKPILAYSIEAALESNLFSEVMVSTDVIEIAEVARQYGAKIPFYRSENASDDYATTFDVLDEVLTNYYTTGKSFDNVCCLYPCAPFVNSQKLITAYEILCEGSFESVIPVVAYSFPIQRSFNVKDNKLSYKYPEFEKTRSQDLEKIYHDTGQFYWCKANSLIKNKGIMNQNTGFLELTELEIQDIDNDVDWQMAELKFKLLNQ
jgi:N-acylneuraminate cytidylyltransferase